MFGAGDATNLRRAELRDRVVMMLAGKAAEAHLLGDASTGAADDVRRAAVLAEAIVKTYGLSQDGAVFTSWIDEYGKRHAIGGDEADAAVRAELAEAEGGFGTREGPREHYSCFGRRGRARTLRRGGPQSRHCRTHSGLNDTLSTVPPSTYVRIIL